MQEFNPMANWGETAKRLLGDDFWNSISGQFQSGVGTGPSQGIKSTASVPVDLVEAESEYYVLVDLPGLRHPQTVDVYVEGDVLYIKGEASPILPRGEVRQMERRRGAFERSIALPGPVQKDAVRARYENGVMEIKLPKLKNKGQRMRVPIDF